MTATCPHRNTSYALWRLQVIRQLCSNTALHLTRTTTTSTSLTNKRCFHSSNPAQLRERRRRPAEPATGRYDVARTARLPNVRLRRVTQRLAVRRVEGVPQNRKDELGTWNPRTPTGKQQLKDMIAELEILTQESVERDKLIRTQRTPYAIHYQKEELVGHESPLEKRLRSRHLPPKKQAKREDMDPRLKHNTWASLLASPLRQCVATKVRMPKDLMASWGIVRHPQTQQDYLMPVELSDVQILRDRMLTEEDQYRVVNGVRVPIKLPSGKPPEGQRVQIQTNQLLTRTITHFVMRSSGSEQTTLSGVLGGSLIPGWWRQKLDEIAAFKRTQKTVNPVTGSVIIASDDWKKNVPDLQVLQWQPDIHTRIHRIMVERVLIALQGVVANNTSQMAIRARRVLTIDLPDCGTLNLKDDKVLESLRDKPEKQSTAIPPKDMLDENVDTKEDVEEIILDSAQPNQSVDLMKEENSTGQSVTGDKPSVATSEAGSEKSGAIQEDESRSNARSADLAWMYGSIFLHIGSPAQYIATIESWHAANRSKKATPSAVPTCAPSLESFIPPVVSIQSSQSTHNIPIFNLYSLLGPHAPSPQIIKRIDALTQDYSVLDYRFWANYNESKSIEIKDKAVLREAESKVSSPPTPPLSDSTSNSAVDAPPEPFQPFDSSDFSSNIGAGGTTQDPSKNDHWDFKDMIADLRDSGSEAPNEYVVLIKGTAVKARELKEEIWRLWRYTGGRQGVWVGGEEAKMEERAVNGVGVESAS